MFEKQHENDVCDVVHINTKFKNNTFPGVSFLYICWCRSATALFKETWVEVFSCYIARFLKPHFWNICQNDCVRIARFLQWHVLKMIQMMTPSFLQSVKIQLLKFLHIFVPFKRTEWVDQNRTKTIVKKLNEKSFVRKMYLIVKTKSERNTDL